MSVGFESFSRTTVTLLAGEKVAGAPSMTRNAPPAPLLSIVTGPLLATCVRVR